MKQLVNFLSFFGTKWCTSLEFTVWKIIQWKVTYTTNSYLLVFPDLQGTPNNKWSTDMWMSPLDLSSHEEMTSGSLSVLHFFIDKKLPAYPPHLIPCEVCTRLKRTFLRKM